MTEERAFHVPADLHYDPEQHLWLRWQPESGTVRLGIDALGLESLGELAYVSLQAVGMAVARSESLGTLEAAKMTTHLAAPVAGKLVARNAAALANPALVNDDPYGGGWLLELEPECWEEESGALVHGAAVEAWVEREVARLDAESAIG